MDYSRFKSLLKQIINTSSKKYVNSSCSDLEIVKSDIQDNQATVEIQFNWKALNLDTLEEDSGKEKRQVSLTKEDGVWKIIKIRTIELSKIETLQ